MNVLGARIMTGHSRGETRTLVVRRQATYQKIRKVTDSRTVSTLLTNSPAIIYVPLNSPVPK